MTARETQIAKRILDHLHKLDGGQAHALAIHAEIGGVALCSGSEFDSVMEILNQERWVIGIHTKFKGNLWNISDAGEAARLQM